MLATTITDQEFNQIRRLLHELAGIHMSDAKKNLVCGRLGKRVEKCGFKSYGEYFQLLSNGQNPGELQVAIDLLTTNETHFFREPKHFDFLRERILVPHRTGQPFRIWSAACSSGQEPYTLAMVLADHFGDAAWDIVASDLSTRVLERARAGQYALEQAEEIPETYLRKYCMKGVGPEEGTFIIDRRLRSRIGYQQINLNQTLPRLGEFDVIFLRNVMIYFNTDTKRQVVDRLLQQLKPGGHLFIGHSESLNGIADSVTTVVPSVYRRL
ncbi:MAG: protein-glutamate O-methyltransferase CheR [Gammaproteobacteria bacterium]|nr:protein-glutamate O-methyltransferase CheR [Gammaproteobacteria bacterium]